MTEENRPAWLLPPGVPRGVWDYAHSPQVAATYDQQLAGHPLLAFDEQLLSHAFATPGRLVDLGCGTGRLMVAMARRGHFVLGVDLSPHMLRAVRQKAAQTGLALPTIQASLVELGCLADGAFDYAICMFNTLGMIRGTAHRHQALQHFRRILRGGGWLALHVHNRWFHLHSPMGRRWVLAGTLRPWFDRQTEAGDHVFADLGIPNLFVHSFSRREIRGALCRAGFHIHREIPLDVRHHRPLSRPWFLGSLRATGWILLCRAV